MKRWAFILGLTLPAVCSAQLPGIFDDILRAVQKPAAAPQQHAAPATPGILAETSVEEEVAIGRQLAGNLLGAAPLATDAALQRYVNRVGRWVASRGERRELNWYFGVLESDAVNAFALPGGYVFITRGLFGLLSDEAELAGVLAHEIGHVQLQHHLKVLKKSQAIGMIGGLLESQVSLGRGAEGHVKQRVTQQLIGKGAEAMARGLDKSAEFEADRVGVVLATRAGYAPYGLPSVLRKIGQRNPGDASLSLLFKTHPLPQERLESLGDTMGASFDRYSQAQALPARFKAVKGAN
jgi:beta-barrel assembly-enhancing protease